MLWVAPIAQGRIERPAFESLRQQRVGSVSSPEMVAAVQGDSPLYVRQPIHCRPVQTAGPTSGSADIETLAAGTRSTLGYVPRATFPEMPVVQKAQVHGLYRAIAEQRWHFARRRVAPRRFDDTTPSGAARNTLLNSRRRRQEAPRPECLSTTSAPSSGLSIVNSPPTSFTVVSAREINSSRSWAHITLCPIHLSLKTTSRRGGQCDTLSVTCALLHS